MTFNEICRIAQKVFLDDIRIPTLWKPEDLELFANEAEREAALRSELLVDNTTPSICQVSVVADTAEYNISSKIIRIVLLTIPSNTYPVEQKTEEWLDDVDPAWRTLTGTPVYYVLRKNKLRLVPIPTATETATMKVVRYPLVRKTSSGISIQGSTNISFSATGNIISKTGADFYLEGLLPGNILTITGTTTNDGEKTVSSVAQASLVVEETLVTQASTSALIVSDFLPEIDEQYHFDLIDWMCHLAYGKRNSETENEDRETKYSSRFTDKFGTRPSAKSLHYRKYMPRKGESRGNGWFRF
jgi:hypothetical protein